MAISQIIQNSLATGVPSASNITTGTLPIAQGGSGTTTGQAIVPIQVVNLAGLSSASFVVNAYPSYMVFFDDISGTTSGANFQLKASYDGGATYPANWNYVEILWGVSGATSTNYANTGNSSQAWLWTNVWDGAGTPGTSSTGGYVKIQGGGAYWGVNKRMTFEGEFGGQSPSGQEVRLCMGQTQDDAHQYNVVQVSLSSGTFQAQARMLVCGIKAA